MLRQMRASSFRIYNKRTMTIEESIYISFDETNITSLRNEACALVVQAAIDSNVKLLKVYEDSALGIHQLRGE